MNTTIGALRDLETIVCGMNGASNDDWRQLFYELRIEKGRIAFAQRRPVVERAAPKRELCVVEG